MEVVDLTLEDWPPKPRRKRAAAEMDVIDLLDDDEEVEEMHPCAICCDDLPESKTLLLSCGHRFCAECSKTYVAGKIREGQVAEALTCPAVTDKACKRQMIPFDVRRCLGEAEKALMQKYEDFSLKKFIDEHNESGFSCCPTAGCPFVFEWAPADRKFSCPACKNIYCLMCKVEWHRGVRCEDYKRPPSAEEADEAFHKLVKQSKMKQCPKCKLWVQKESGCNHMVCRCKAQFCYLCGELMQQKGGCRCLKENLGDRAHLANLRAHHPQGFGGYAEGD